MIGIYGIKNKINGKIYVGKSIQIEKRMARHKRILFNNEHFNKHLQNSFNKYGCDEFEFFVIEQTSPEHLIDREQHWVDHFLNGEGVYNKMLDVRICPGDSFLNCTHSIDTKEKMSFAKKGKYLGENNPSYRIKWTPEKRKKCISNNSGTKLTEFDVLEIVKLLKSNSIKDEDIAKQYNVSRSVITRIANGTRWSHITGGKIMNERRGIKNIGKQRSEETKNKISQAITGITRSENTKIKISQSKLGKKHRR